eukprot:XP_015573425.1 uncharacterized protein LOC107261098 [Ricinus communis]
MSFRWCSKQFSLLPNEDPNAYIASFLEIYDTFKINGTTNDAIHLRLFPLSLRDRAKRWLQSLPPNTIITWNSLFDDESMYNTWERYKDLLRCCPHHGHQYGYRWTIWEVSLGSRTTRTETPIIRNGEIIQMEEQQQLRATRVSATTSAAVTICSPASVSSDSREKA